MYEGWMKNRKERECAVATAGSSERGESSEGGRDFVFFSLLNFVNGRAENIFVPHNSALLFPRFHAVLLPLGCGIIVPFEGDLLARGQEVHAQEIQVVEFGTEGLLALGRDDRKDLILAAATASAPALHTRSRSRPFDLHDELQSARLPVARPGVFRFAVREGSGDEGHEAQRGGHDRREGRRGG